MLWYKDDFCKKYALRSSPKHKLAEEFADIENKQLEFLKEHKLLGFSKEINKTGIRYYIVENSVFLVPRNLTMQ